MAFADESINREKVRNHNPLPNIKESFKILYSDPHSQKDSLHVALFTWPPNLFFYDQSKAGKKEGFGLAN